MHSFSGFAKKLLAQNIEHLILYQKMCRSRRFSSFCYSRQPLETETETTYWFFFSVQLSGQDRNPKSSRNKLFQNIKKMSLKFMIVCAEDSNLIDKIGPYLSNEKNNDSSFTKDIFDKIESLKTTKLPCSLKGKAQFSANDPYRAEIFNI
ncbi:hypothetical protein BpHYR1_007309 [Brachionus plicatilis]|uniref:Uncharacterized protein n=1 Tax=Brachionus plicatilis TaxID=10195 RepID=A0A3M7RC16_BRAPC|nr:hypothetical protein BpHYR1_007309 [Brachionus plicatilis]